ncbi:MAG: hypothetical protein L7H00_05130 [Vulcanisaeta sp.]|nr:hypothetical protein [Vulcanisaeta sp.]
MSNAVEFRYFKLNDNNVMYFKAEDGYAICVEKNGVKVCGKFRLINVSEDAIELAKALRSQKINITTEEVREILTKVKIGYFEDRESKDLGAPPPQQSQQAQQQPQLQQSPQQSNSSMSLGFMHTSGKTVVEVVKLPAGIVIYYPTRSEGENGSEGEPIQIYDGSVEAKVIRDKYLHGEVRYILKTPYGTYVGRDLASVVKEFRDNDTGITTADKRLIEGAIRLLFKSTEEEDGYAYTGFYPDGWRVGYIDYPVKEPKCDAKLIEDFIKWVNTYYNKNRVFVLGNFALIGAKHFTPAIRITRVFEDRVLINSGPRYLGKSTAQRTIMRIYGLPPNDDYIRIVGDNAIETAPRMRNFLTRYLSAPLFFDEIGETAFKAIARFLLGSTTDSAVIGAQASQYEFEIKGARPLRSMVVNTNLERGEIEEILRDIAGPAYTRRVAIFEWYRERVKAEVDELYPDTNILGCLIDIWNRQDWRNEILKSRSIYHVAMYINKYLSINYGVNMDPITNALYAMYEQHVRESEEDIMEEEPSDVDKLIARAIKLAKGKAQGPDPPLNKVLNYILHSDHVRFATAQDDIEKLKEHEFRKLKDIIENELGINISSIQDIDALESYITDSNIKMDEDTRGALLTAIRNIKSGRVRIHILVGEKHLVTKAHRQFMGIKIQYKNGYYYPMSVTDFIALFLRRSIDEGGETTETDENHGENREPKQK